MYLILTLFSILYLRQTSLANLSLNYCIIFDNLAQCVIEELTRTLTYKKCHIQKQQFYEPKLKYYTLSQPLFYYNALVSSWFFYIFKSLRAQASWRYPWIIIRILMVLADIFCQHSANRSMLLVSLTKQCC